MQTARAEVKQSASGWHLIKVRMAPYRALLLYVLAALPLAAVESAPSVLARMDAEAASFRQITAKVTNTTYTAVLSDTTRESGVMRMRRNGNKIQMRTDFTGTNARSYAFDGASGQVYYPKINTVQIYDLGRNRALVDQFLILGFGSSGTDLKKNYSIRTAGEDEVAGGKTTRLELVPLSAKVKEQIQKVELWIPMDAGHPVQQKFYQPGGDYYLFTYSDIKLNQNLPEDEFHLKIPANARREYPQK